MIKRLSSVFAVASLLLGISAGAVHGGRALDVSAKRLVPPVKGLIEGQPGWDCRTMGDRRCGTMPSGPTLAARIRAPAVVRNALLSSAECRGDSACLERLVRFETGRLGSRIASIAGGPSGLAEWVRLAAELHGSVPATLPQPPDLPLGEATLSLYRGVGLEVTPDISEDVAMQVARLSPSASGAIAGLVNALVLAVRLTSEAQSGTGIEELFNDPARPFQLISLVGSTVPGTAPTIFEAEWNHIVDVLLRVDIAKVVTATMVIAEALAAYEHVAGQPDLDFSGLIFVGGEGNTIYEEDYILTVDISGDDTYLNNSGGPWIPVDSAIQPIGVLFGVAWDMGEGRDHYRRGRMGQAYGFAGPGILLDEGGADLYELTEYGQGAAVAGVGVLYDAGSGDDQYLSPFVQDETLSVKDNPIATKAAALGGIGLLVDEGGSDVFHQDKLDGLVWGAAGGLGLLASLGPESDVYRSLATFRGEVDHPEAFAGPIQVSAEVAGAAILFEEGGDEVYECGAFVRGGCQGASGDDSLGLLWDRGGNDVYTMGRSVSIDLIEDLVGLRPTAIEHPVFPMGQGAGYAVGVPGTGASSFGVLYDESGNDIYRAEKWAQGYGTFGGLGFLYDTGGGDDRYETAPPLSGVRRNGMSWVDGLVGIGIDR